VRILKTFLTAALLAAALLGGLFVAGAVALVILAVIGFRRLTDPRHVTLAHAHAGHMQTAPDDDAIDIAATEVTSAPAPLGRLTDSPPDRHG
jgi:hypothetical protein